MANRTDEEKRQWEREVNSIHKDMYGEEIDYKIPGKKKTKKKSKGK
jgi:hypothetical protein